MSAGTVPDSAVVTGAGRGMGRAIVRALHAHGLRVWLTDVDEAAAEAAAGELGERATSARLDVSDRAECRALAARVRDEAGSLDVWVNNAGVLATGYVWDHDDATIERLFRINAFGVVNGTLAALEHMRSARHGHVVNIVSLAGLVAPPSEALYASTKHAALAFSVGTLLDLRRAGLDDVHVSAVCPDGVWTPMLEPHVEDPDAWPSWSGVMLRPEQVADAVVALLDHPRPVIALPRWRGGVARLFAAAPTVGLRLLPLVIADARRKQRNWAKRLRA